MNKLVGASIRRVYSSTGAADVIVIRGATVDVEIELELSTVAVEELTVVVLTEDSVDMDAPIVAAVDVEELTVVVLTADSVDMDAPIVAAVEAEELTVVVLSGD